jgi:predicted amidophosphoribosyltransferase
VATVRELSAPYENFMLAPRRGDAVCSYCFNLTDGYRRCYACSHQPAVLDVVAPISYSVAHEQLHHALASYKRLNGTAGRRLAVQLAAVLCRYLEIHESCIAHAAGLSSFSLVTTVPSGDHDRDQQHRLRWIAAEVVGVTRSRYERLLRRSAARVAPRAFAPGKYGCERELTGETVLLIDDTWTTGANAQSAAAALKAAGAGVVAAVVIGRHVNREWHENDRRLRALLAFDWSRCVTCAGEPAAVGHEATPP